MVSLVGQGRQSADFRFRDDNDVDRRLGCDVSDREYVVIFINKISWDLSIEDLGVNGWHDFNISGKRGKRAKGGEFKNFLDSELEPGPLIFGFNEGA